MRIGQRDHEKNTNGGVLLTSDASSEPPYHTAKLSESVRVSARKKRKKM